MDTPIADFVKKYCEKSGVRCHMPGHKGSGPMGFEALDITEIKGADALYEASGIIEKSESNATALLGTQRTFFSTEGSSQCIRAMLFLAVSGYHGSGRPCVLAARNVHKSFLYAAAVLDFDVEWLYSDTSDSICSCIVSPEALEAKLASMKEKPQCVYITSPDYLGGMSDIAGLARVCHRYGILLLVDNAHGAYLKFLPRSMHPMDLGADMCCDSAHKTLPALTGAAYLHIARSAPERCARDAKQALAMFGSTSPSYLILQSLDLCNAYIDGDYGRRLGDFLSKLDSLKEKLTQSGFDVLPSDPLKLVFRCRGIEMAERLREAEIECEYADPDYLVLMMTPENTDGDMTRLLSALTDSLENSRVAWQKVSTEVIPMSEGQRVMSVREALFSPHETVSVRHAIGKVCGTPLVSCPPAIPIVVSGERIDENAVKLFEKYGITQVEVIAE